MGGKVGRTSQGRRLFRVFRVFRRPSSVSGVSSASGASSASRASGAIGCRWDVGSIGYRVFCHVYYLFCRRKPCGSAATKTVARWVHSRIPFWEFALTQLPHCAHAREYVRCKFELSCHPFTSVHYIPHARTHVIM